MRVKYVCFVAFWLLASSGRAATVKVCFRSTGRLMMVEREVAETASPAQAAVEALAAGPTEAEQSQGIFSAITAGARIQQFVTSDSEVTIDFSRDLMTKDFGDALLEDIYEQTYWTVWQNGLNRKVKLTSDGKLLADYLQTPPDITPKPIVLKSQSSIQPLSLSGHSVTLGPAHGNYWNGSSWPTQRPAYCSPLNEEDYHCLEMSQYLETYLVTDGMTVRLCRCTDKSFGVDSTSTATHVSSGLDWWKMAGYLWIQQLGYPCSVYGSSTGNCITGSGADEYNDDIRARPLMSNMDNTEIFVALHTDGVSGFCTGASCPTGTKTFYDASSSHAAWGAASQALAIAINAKIISAVTLNADPTWSCSRGSFNGCAIDSNGNYGEIRIPQRPASLTELAFHDTCDRDADANHLRDNFFRSACMWGMYNGICTYFGQPPTWDFYSDEYVSDTIPANMSSGQSYNVSITFRNRGVLWNSARNFQLGAVGDSDPFTASTRFNLASEVGPANNYIFSFQMTAPLVCGDYVSDWQMVRNSTWFGATVSRNIHVASAAPAAPDLNNDGHINDVDFGIFAACITGPDAPYDPDNLPAGCTLTPDCEHHIPADIDRDGDVDQGDFGRFQRCFNGNGAIPPGCAN